MEFSFSLIFGLGSRGSSVGIAAGHVLDCRGIKGSNPGGGKRYFSSYRPEDPA
jgi:hypothetical protein